MLHKQRNDLHNLHTIDDIYTLTTIYPWHVYFIGHVNSVKDILMYLYATAG